MFVCQVCSSFPTLLGGEVSRYGSGELKAGGGGGGNGDLLRGGCGSRECFGLSVGRQVHLDPALCARFGIGLRLQTPILFGQTCGGGTVCVLYIALPKGGGFHYELSIFSSLYMDKLQYPAIKLCETETEENVVVE